MATNTGEGFLAVMQKTLELLPETQAYTMAKARMWISFFASRRVFPTETAPCV